MPGATRQVVTPLAKYRLSDNVGGVKPFSSALQHALIVLDARVTWVVVLYAVGFQT
jgi:hypothetical protein